MKLTNKILFIMCFISLSVMIFGQSSKNLSEELYSNKDLYKIVSTKNGTFSSNYLKYQSKSLLKVEQNNKQNFKLNFNNENDDDNFYDKPLFKILLGSFVALGATAAYFKIKADKRFEEYKSTNNSALLDETNRYDTYGGIAIGLMQINLGVLVYFFLRD